MIGAPLSGRMCQETIDRAAQIIDMQAQPGVRSTPLGVAEGALAAADLLADPITDEIIWCGCECHAGQDRS